MSDFVDEMLGTLEPQQPAGQAQQPQMAPVSGGGGSLADEMLSSLDAPEPTQPTQGKGTPDDPFRGVIEFGQKLQEARQLGQYSFRDAALGHAVRSGNMTLEEAEAKIAADDEQAHLSADLDQYVKDSQVPWLSAIAVETTKSLPMFEASLAPFTAGAAIGGGATAATGVGAVVAVPFGALTGSATAAGWTADIITGQEYLNRRRGGMGHEAASAASTISGLIQGTLSGVQFGQAAKVPINAAKSMLEQHAINLGKFLMEGIKFEFGQLALAEAQTITRLITDAISGTVADAPGVVPTLERAAEEFWKTAQTTLTAGAGFFVGGKIVGAGTGMALRSGRDVVNHVQQVKDAHLKNQAAKIERMQAKINPDEADAEPATSQPAEKSKNAQTKERRTAERLDKREAAEREVRRIFDAAKSLFTVDTPETKMQEANRVQRLLKRMVTNSDKLDDAMKTRLLSRVIEIDSVSDLLREGDRFIEDQRGREHANEVKAAEKKLYGAIESGQQKDKKAKLPAPVQQSLKWYKEFFTEPEPTNTGRKSEPGAGDMGEQKPKGEPAAKGEPGADKMNEPTAAESRQKSETKDLALKKALDYIDKGIEEERKKLEQQIDKLESGELSELFTQPAELAEKKRIAMQAVQYWSGNLDPKKVLELAGEIEAMVKEGKSDFFERKQAESENLLTARAEVVEAVQGIKPVTPSIEKSTPKQIGAFGKVLHSLTKTSTSLWDELLQDVPADERQKLVAKHLDFTDVENREAKIVIDASQKIHKLYVEAAGSIKEARRVIQKGDDPRNRVEIQYTDTTGNSAVEMHRPVDLAYLYMAMDDPGAVPGLTHGNKYTLEGMVEDGHTSTQEAIRDALSKFEGGKLLQLADAVKDAYRWFAPQVGNHYLKEYGVALPMDDNYSGQIQHRHLERIKSAGDLMEDVHNFARRSLDPGSTKLRTNSKLPVKPYNPFQQLERHVSDMAFWIANSEKARELSFIFSDSSKDGLRDIIQHKRGEEYTGLIDSRIAFQFHLKPGLMDIGDGPFRNVKGNMATGLLYARIDQGPKQLTSILATLSTSTPAEFIDGFVGAFDKKRMDEYLSRSELYRDRQDQIRAQVQNVTKQPDFGDIITAGNKLTINQFFGIPMVKWGDGVGAAIGGFIEFNRVLKSGGTMEEAVLAGDGMVDRTASSSRDSQKVPAEMKGGIASWSLAFQKEGIQAMNRESGAIRDFLVHKDDKHLARMARTIVSIHLAQTIFQTLNNMPAFVVGDEKEQEQAALRIGGAAIGGSFAQLPLIGWDVMAGALSGFKGEQEPRTVIGGLAGDSAKLVKRTWNLVKKSATGDEITFEDWAKEFKSMAAVASVASGLPFWGLFKYADLGRKVVEKGQEQ